MPDLSILSTPSPYHILTYGALLGTQIFQSFIGGPLAFRALPRPQFAVLQSSIFPVYFGMQTVLPAVLALTFPAKATSTSSSSALLGGGSGSAAAGILHAASSTELYTILGVGLAGLLNWAIVGPATTKVMRERKGQEVRDGKKSYDKGPHSEAMLRLNRKFGKLHGVSSLVNLGALIATMWYGVMLAGRLQ